MDRSVVKEYYARVTAVDIGDVAKKLLGDRLTATQGGCLRFDCPHHSSQSKASFIVDLGKQAFFCKGCGVGGDVLQLVEFVQSGQVTSHCAGDMPDSHRQARDFLASHAGLLPLGEYGLSQAELLEVEGRRQEEQAVYAVLTDVAEFYHEKLLAKPEAIEWFTERYAIGIETVKSLRIGLADNEGFFKDYLHKSKGHSWDAIKKSGCAVVGKQDGLYAFFRNRLIFPYWKHGRVVYLIGRKTPWTPDNEYEAAKYKKLPTHSPTKPYISHVVQNDVFYNEDCLAGERDEVVITEGVTDCIALLERGVPCISPVTVCFRDRDHQKLLSLVRHVEKVFVCQDNEISGVGTAGALKTARFLTRHDVAVRMVELPLGDKQRAARTALAEHGIVEGIDPKELDRIRDALPEDEQQRVDAALADAKIDLNDYLLSNSADDFRELMANAPPPVHWQIQRLDPKPVTLLQRNDDLKPVLETLAELPPLDQASGVEMLQQHYGRRNLPKKLLEDSIKQYARELASRAEADEPTTTAPEGTCEAAIEVTMRRTAKEEEAVNWNRVAEAAYDWFTAHGASFFHTPEARVFMSFEYTTHEMVANPNSHRRYLATMQRHTGMNCMTPTGRIFFEGLANVAYNRGEQKECFSWSHTDRKALVVYFNLYNARNEIVKITPDGVEVMRNGSNPDNVLLVGSRKMRPIEFKPDIDLGEADRLVAALLCDSFTCDDNERLLIVHWLSTFLLMDFTETKPMLRFEGAKESGKTAASKLLSALIYGDKQQKRSTTAANYADAAIHPLIILDNIETKNLTQPLIDFMLTAVTGVGNEKRKRGTDSETVTEFARCLICSSGIEPLAGELSEVVSRTFIVDFDIRKSKHDVFDEVGAVDAVADARDSILSALFIRTHKALRLLRDGGKARAMKLIARTLGEHSKRRANEYLALMYLMMIADGDDARIDHDLEHLDPLFVQMMATQQEAATDVQVGSNPVVTLLAGLFQEYAMALRADDRDFSRLGYRQADKFALDYHLEFEDESTIMQVKASELHMAFAHFAKSKGLDYPYRSPKQLGRRLNNDAETLERAGFMITTLKGHAGYTYYTIRRADDRPQGSNSSKSP